MLLNRLPYRVAMGMNAPPMHSICIICTDGSHLSVIVITITSLDTIARPIIAGNVMNAVKRSSLRKARIIRS